MSRLRRMFRRPDLSERIAAKLLTQAPIEGSLVDMVQTNCTVDTYAREVAQWT